MQTSNALQASYAGRGQAIVCLPQMQLRSGSRREYLSPEAVYLVRLAVLSLDRDDLKHPGGPVIGPFGGDSGLVKVLLSLQSSAQTLFRLRLPNGLLTNQGLVANADISYIEKA